MYRFERWREVILAATTPEAVKALMHEYAGAIAPGVVTALPRKCQAALRDPDVQSAAVTLAQADLTFTGSAELAEVLHQIARTYAAASMRIAAITRLAPLG